MTGSKRKLVAVVAVLLTVQPLHAWDWDLPDFISPPPVPDDNPMSAEKVELGRHLFYDARLSRDGTMSCASCHDRARAFSDGRVTSVGIDGDRLPRNAQGLANVGYLPVLTWANPNLDSLEAHAAIPLFGKAPPEMGGGGHEAVIFDRLMEDPYYRHAFTVAFPEYSAADQTTVVRALAAFQRSLTSFDSRYDRYRHHGEDAAIGAAAKRGETLFFDLRLRCFQCHAGTLMTDNIQQEGLAWIDVGFHDIGLPSSGTDLSPGLAAHTGSPSDAHRVRTPTLRNIAVTAPYMHDGSLPDLRAVLNHYAAGGQSKRSGVSGLVRGFDITEAETADLIAFLESLTDTTFLTDPRHADPWPPDHPARMGRADPSRWVFKVQPS